jgi:hypothetical protein
MLRRIMIIFSAIVLIGITFGAGEACARGGYYGGGWHGAGWPGGAGWRGVPIASYRSRYNFRTTISYGAGYGLGRRYGYGAGYYSGAYAAPVGGAYYGSPYGYYNVPYDVGLYSAYGYVVAPSAYYGDCY